MRPPSPSLLRSTLLPLLVASLWGCEGPPGAAGSSCTVLDNGDGTSTISCADGTKVTLASGKDGDDGEDGEDGLDGVDGGQGLRGPDGTSCTVGPNPDGGLGKLIRCTDGTAVFVSDGRDGTDGEPGGGVEIEKFHGTQRLLSDLYDNTGKFYANAAITSATADDAGVVTVKFTVKDRSGAPLTTLTSASANIAKLVEPVSGEKTSTWVAYLYRSATAGDGGWPMPPSTKVDQATSESNGSLTNHGDGSYTYVLATNLAKAKLAVDGGVITYDRGRLHRVVVMLGGKSSATASPHFDFVPDGSDAGLTRQLVETKACKACHGNEFKGHGGNRVTVESCTTCHTPLTLDPQSGETMDLKVMVHKIHAGGSLASIPGPDGLVFDDPATPANESSDNGKYIIWGNGNGVNEWSRTEFPAVISNCTKCHTGTGANVSAWMTASRSACGSCHDTVNFATGQNHSPMAGSQTTDDNCGACHPAQGVPLAVKDAHEWMRNDPRNVPEFDVSMTMTPPANGKYYVSGEAPQVTLQLRSDGALIDHTTIVADSTNEGCLQPDGGLGNGCVAGDGKFGLANFFVQGPRAKHMPVLTSKARVFARSLPDAGVAEDGGYVFDLSADGGSLALKVDNGEDLLVPNTTTTTNLRPGTLTIPVTASAFKDRAKAEPSEIVAWLNANASFKARAIAYLDESAGPPARVAIRSRNLGKLFALQLLPSTVTSAVFGNDTAIKVITGSYPSNYVSKQSSASSNDPKVTWSTDKITYALDPVDDLQPGTYIAYATFGDRYRVSTTNYKIPSWAMLEFQVKTGTPEKPVADGCASCHQSAGGAGFVLDPGRHGKVFGDKAMDQCGVCHDYQPSAATGEYSGGHPISKRVHAVHFGSKLFYPMSTVAYGSGDPVAGRQWNITLPQDVRNCEVCHSANSSGTWKNKANRLACLGCHDSDAARGHVKAMTADPTPLDPWSGDETESCTACH